MSYGPTKRRAALRGAAKFSKRGPTKSRAARENPVVWDADQKVNSKVKDIKNIIFNNHKITTSVMYPFDVILTE